MIGMKHKKHRREKNGHLNEELAGIDAMVGKLVTPAGKGVDLKPGTGEDPVTRKLMEQERAFLNPEEWGIDLRPIVKEELSLPDPKELEDLDDAAVAALIRCLADIFARYHLCLTSTNHLSDRELYRFILTEVLPQPVGIGPNPVGGLLYHECCPCESDEFLMYHATDDMREDLQREFDIELPEKRPCVSNRDDWLEDLAESYRFKPLPKVSHEGN
jgi:hypothetical protein